MYRICKNLIEKKKKRKRKRKEMTKMKVKSNTEAGLKKNA